MIFARPEHSCTTPHARTISHPYRSAFARNTERIRAFPKPLTLSRPQRVDYSGQTWNLEKISKSRSFLEDVLRSDQAMSPMGLGGGPRPLSISYARNAGVGVSTR